MTEQNDDVAVRVTNLAVSACIDLFQAYRVRLSSDGAAWGQSDEPLLSGIIGFVGSRVRGSCLLASTEASIAATCPPGGRLRDWVGELTNQLMGRLKSKLVARELAIELSTPIVLSGVRIQPLPKARLEPTVLSATQGAVLVWLEIETAPGFVLSAERDGLSGSEGDVLIFD
jgi:CheY-specific phosphatase CheX